MPNITKEDICDALSDFYGRMIEPEFRAIRGKLEEHDQKFKDLIEHFDRIYTRLDRLETEYYSLVAAVDRIEHRLDNVEQRLGKIEVCLDGIDQKLDKEISIREIIEREIKDLKERISVLQDRIDDLEKRL